MKTKTTIYSGTAALALVAAGVWAFAPRPLPVELAPVSLGPFETTINEDGKTRLADRFVVSAPLTGHLVRSSLREGDAVAANATVARLTPALPAMLDERAQRELRARVEGAQARVQQASARIERAQVMLAQAQSDAKRSEALARQGFIAPTKLESDVLGSLAAQKEVNAAVEDRHVAQHEVEQARAALGATQTSAALGGGGGGSTGAAARSAAGTFAVHAPAAGQVLRVLQTSEAMVAMGTPLMEIGDVHKLEVVVDLLTTDAPSAQPGSLVYIERWGGPAPLQGRVVRVEPAAFTKVSALGVEEQRVRVVVALTSPAEQWRALGDGYRVSVRVVTLSQEQAQQVPVSAVFPLPSATESAAPQFAVFTFQAGRAHVVPVDLGGRNGSMAWIKSGLPPTAQVVVYPPSTLRDGARVAQRKV
jgi:HlyD family secretion protein